MSTIDVNDDALAFGAVYHPELSSQTVWEDDIALMKKAGVNRVSVGVFAWAHLEVDEGSFSFGWLDQILDLLGSAGISVNLGTATATPPAWMVHNYPEMKPQDSNGQVLEFGARQTYCPSSPVWRHKVRDMARTMAKRYGSHPAVAQWHVSHEYGDHVGRCWCPASSEHFRSWLQERYATIDELNMRWGTASWSLSYTSWAQIAAPRRAVGPINPAHLLDFERFSSDAFIELFELEAEVLREETPALPLSTNFISLRRDVNYWKMAQQVDVVTDNAYPDPSDPETHLPAALNYDLMRSLRDGQPWMLLEHSTSAVSWRSVNPPKPFGLTRVTAMQAVAHGSDSVLFNQWRQPRYGIEKYHSAIVGHRGEESRTYTETVELGATIGRLDRVKGSRVRGTVALIVDWDSWWASSAAEGLPSTEFTWLEQTRVWHAALSALGHTVDIVRPEGPFGSHTMVFAPNLYVTTEEQGRALNEFVARGGHLVVGPFSGVVDATDIVHDGGAPGPLRTLLGVEVDEQWPLDPGVEVAVSGGAHHSFASRWTESLVVSDPDTQILASYTTGPLTGSPALTRKLSGAGSASYVGYAADRDALALVFRDALRKAGLRARDVMDARFEAVTRSDGQHDFTFILNHGTESLTVDATEPGTDLITGKEYSGTFILAPYQVLVLSNPTSPHCPFLTVSAK